MPPSIPMPSINQVAFSGRLMQAPEARQTENNRFRITFLVAVNIPYKDEQGNWQQEITGVPVLVWDRLAEVVVKRLAKGTAVFITGRLHSTETALGVTARHIQFLPAEPPSNRKDAP